MPTPTVAALHLYVVANGSPVTGVDGAAPDPATAWAWGAGTDAAAARVRALGEALEVRAGTGQGDEPVRMARWCELDERAVHSHELQLFSDRQYARRHDTNCQAPRWAQVPEPFARSRGCVHRSLLVPQLS